LKGIGLTGPSQFPWSQFYVGADAFPVMIAINEKISIESESHGIIFKRGSVHVNNYLDGGSTLLKKFVGIVFAPLFYCFRHPLLLLAVFFCLSALFILIEHVMNNRKNDEFAWIYKRNRNKRKQHQNAAPYVLFIREKKRRSPGDRKSLSDEKHHVQAS